MLLNFELTGKSTVLRSFLLPAGAFLLLSVVALSSSSEADEPLFVRSAQQLERLWGGVLGCAESDEAFTVRNRFNDSGGFEGTDGGVVPAGESRDYSECGKRALRNASSRMLVDTIEDAVRSGGVALSDQNFRLDSSIGWIWGENVTGELDAVVPLWSRTNPGVAGEALFLQPGVVFWPGLEEEDRIDGNLGVVYRRKLATDVIMGGSVFFDRDFKQGNQRLGLGLDLQSNFLHTAVNYYHPLNDWRRGARANYVEQPLQGADLRLEFAWPRIELDTSLGVWRFEGEEREKTSWHSSFEVAAGFEVRPGVFLRGGYEKHSGDSLGSRWNAGLAFQFSMPGFEAARGGRSLPQASLFAPVTREKRILYEERLDFAVRLEEPEQAFIAEPGNLGGRPAATTITGVISGRDVREEETIEVVLHESTTAEHGAGYDFVFSQAVYGVDARTGEQITATGSAACAASPCRMAVPAGVNARTIEIEVSALDDLEPAEVHEHIDVRVDIRDGSGSLVYSSNVVRVTIGAHGNTVGIASSSDSELMENGGTATVTVDVSMPSPTPITLQVGAEGTARRGEDYRASTSLAIPAGVGSATLTLTGIDNDRPEGNKMINLSLSGGLPDGWEYAVNTHDVTLHDDDLNIGFTTSNPTLVEEDDGNVNLTVVANQPLPEEVSVRWVVSEGVGEFTGSTDGNLVFGAGDDGDDPQTIALTLNDDGSPENAEEVTVVLIADSLPDGWSLGDDTHSFTIEPSDGTIAFAAGFSTLTINEGETRTIEITSTVNGPSGGYPLTLSISPDPSGQINFPRTVRLAPGQRRTSFAITIIDDSDLEEAQDYTMSLVAGANAPGDWRAVDSRQEITIPPSDGRIGFAAARLTADEGGSSVETTLAMNPVPTSEVLISMSISGNAVLGTDYTRTLSANGSNVAYRDGVVYPAGAASVVFSVSAMEDGDSVGENATYRITSFPEGYAAGENSSLEIVLNDNDIGDVQFAATGLTASANEGEVVRLQVVASTAATERLPVVWSVAPAGEVGRGSSGTTYIERGGRTATFSFTIANPATPDPEGAETITVTLDGSSLPTGWVLGGRSAHPVNVPPNDRQIGFSSASGRVLESAGHYDLVFSLNQTSTVALPVRISAPGITVSSPDAPGNWNAGTGTYTIPANSVDAKVRLDFPEDNDNNDNNYTITFSEGGGFPSSEGWDLVGTRFALTVEDPVPDTVQFASSSGTSVDEGDTIMLRVEVTGVDPATGSGVAIPLSWVLTDADDDIVNDSGNVTIPANANFVEFEIETRTDFDREGDERFTVALTNDNLPEGYTFSATRRNHEFIINANNNLIGLSEPVPCCISETGGAASVVTLVITGARLSRSSNLRIDFSGVDDSDFTVTAASPAAFRQANGGGVLIIPAGVQSVEISVVAREDNVAEVGEDIGITMNFDHADTTLPAGWGVAPGTAGMTREISIDANGNTVGFASPTSSVAEDDGTGVDVTIDIDLPLAPGDLPAADRMIDVALGGTAQSGDYEVTGTGYANGVLTLEAGASTATLTVTPQDNEIIGGNKTVTLDLSRRVLPTGWLIGSQSTHTVTILDNERIIERTVSFSVRNSSVEEGGQVQTADLIISPAPSEEIVIPVSVTGDSNAYSLVVTGGTYANKGVTFPAGTGTARFTLTPVNDSNNTDDAIRFTIGTLESNYSHGANRYWQTNITDNDRSVAGSRVSFVPTATVSGSEGYYDLTLSLSAAAATGLPIRIDAPPDITVSSPDAGASANWNAGASTYTIPSGAGNSATVRLDFPDRSEDELKTYTVGFSEGANFPSSLGWGLAGTSFALTVEYSDPNTVLFAADSPTSVAEGDPITLTVVVTGGSPGIAIPLDWSLTDADGDITTDSGKVMIPAEGNSVDIVIPTTDDAIPEDDESFTVTLTGTLPTGFMLSTTRGSHEFSIVDDDYYNVDFSGTLMRTITETPGSKNFSALEIVYDKFPSGVTDLPLLLDRGGTAVEGTDYMITGSGYSNGSITLDADDTVAKFEVEAIDDGDNDDNEYLTLSISESNNLPDKYIIGSASVRIDITDNDDLGSREIEIATTSPATASEGDVVTLTVRAGSTPAADLPLVWSVSPADEVDTARGTVTITSASTDNSETFTINIAEDDGAEIAEDITVSLETGANFPGGWSLSQNESHTIRIAANGNVIEFAQTTGRDVNESESGGFHHIPVSITHPYDGILHIGIEPVAADTTAENGSDFGLRTPVEIGPGSSSFDIPFSIGDDDEDEEDETVTVVLTPPPYDPYLPEGWSVNTEKTYTFKIIDNDEPAVFAGTIGFLRPFGTPDMLPSTITEGSGAGVPVPGGVPDSILTVDIFDGDSNNDRPAEHPQLDVRFEITPASYVQRSEGQITIGENAFQQVEIRLVDDDEYKEGEQITITLVDVDTNDGYTIDPVWGSHTFTIIDNDNVVTFGSGSSVASEGTLHNVPVQVRAPAEEAITLNIATDGSATDGSDYSVDSSVTVPANTGEANITINITDDGLLSGERNETIELTLSVPEGASLPEGWSLGTVTHTVTIRGDANTIGLAELERYRINEGDPVDVTVAVDAPLLVEGSVVLAIEGGGSVDVGPLAGSTYSSGVLGLSPGAGSAGVLVVAIDDLDPEREELVTFRISENPDNPLPEGWKIDAAAQRQTLTIEPSDNAISLALPADNRINEGENIDIMVEVDLPLSVDRSVALGIDDRSGIEVAPVAGSVYSNGNLRLVAGESSAGVRVTVADDHDPEIAQDINFTIETVDAFPLPTGWSIETGTLPVTIEASDNTVRFAAPSSSTISEEAEEGNTTTITATIDKPIPEGVTATVAVAPAVGSTAQRGDYTLSVASAAHGSVSGGIWTLPTEAGSAVLTVTAVDNSVDAPDKTLTLGFADDALPTGWVVSGDVSHDIIITNEDLTGTFQFAASQDGDAREGETIQLTVVASQTPEVDVPVTWTITAKGEDVLGPDTGTVTILKGEDTATFDIAITDENVAEYAETVTIALSDTANGADLWTPGSMTEHSIEVFANDNIVRFGAALPPDIAENGGVATITVVMDQPIPVDEPGNTTIRIDPGAPAERTDLRHFYDRLGFQDYNLSVAEDSGSLVINREVDNITLDHIGHAIWTLPKGVERATLTVTAVDNSVSVSAIDSIASNLLDKVFHLGFSKDSLPEGWSVPADTVHEITILDDALPDAEKNVARLVIPGEEGTTITVPENGMASFMMQLSKPDGMPYENPIPGPEFTWFYTITSEDVGDVSLSARNDYHIQFANDGAGLPSAPTQDGEGRGSFSFTVGESYAGGLVPFTISTTASRDDDITEGSESFHYLFHEPRGSSRGLLDAERWRFDTSANEFTLVILSSDNSVEFAETSSEDIPEAGGSALITLNIVNPIDSGETVTVDLDFQGGTEGTDFQIVNGTATYADGKLTLPTEVGEATFTLEALINSAADDTDKTITLTLSDPVRTPLDGWGALGEQTTHTVDIKDSVNKIIGFTQDTVTVAETVDTDTTTLKLQLSNPDGSAYTDAVPEDFSLAYSFTGNNQSDFSVQINGMDAGSTTSTGGTVPITAKAYANGEIPVTIAVTNDDKDEDVEEFVYTIAAPASSLPEGWAIDSTSNSFTLVILASDSNVEFAENLPGSISENGGTARIILDISNPIPDDNTVTVNLVLTGANMGTDFQIVDGTATYADGKLTLPTGATEADFTVEAQDNNRSNAAKNLVLALSNLLGAPAGWAPDGSAKLGDQVSHSIAIEDDDKNTIGFTKGRVAVGEGVGTDDTVMLQLSNPDGSPYTDSVPADLSLQYTLTGTNGNDFSVELEFAAAGTGANLGAMGNFKIPQGHSIDKGEIPVTVTVTDDEVPENVEEFVYTIAAASPPARFPEQTWRVDPDANRLTLVITDNDNSIFFPGTNTVDSPQRLEESAEKLEIPVTLNIHAAQDMTFNVNVTAREWDSTEFPAGNDVEYDSTITFRATDADRDSSAPGHQDAKNIVINPKRDGLAENDESFWISLTPTSPLPPGFVFPSPFVNGNAGGSQAIGYFYRTFVIPAHDNTISYSFNQPTTVAEGESITLSVRPQNNPLPSEAEFTVTSDAEDASDITITPGRVTIPEGHSGEVFTVTANHDDDAVSETVTLTLVPTSFPDGWGITDARFGIHRITIEDDETATVLFDPANETKFVEAEGEVSLRVNFENGVVPAGGMGLLLSSSDPALVRVPEEASSFTIEEGHDSFAFMVDILADGNAVRDTVTLTLRKGTDGNGAGFPDDWNFKDDAERLTLELEIGDRGTIGFDSPSAIFDEPDLVADKRSAPLELSLDHQVPTSDFSLAFHLTTNGAVNDRNTGDFFVDTLYTVTPSEVSRYNTIDYPIFILPDNEYERDESFTLTLAENQPDLPSDKWYINPDKASYTVTIPINDIPSGNTLGFTAPTMKVKERNGDVQIEVVSSAPAPSEGLPLTVSLAKGAGARTVFKGSPTAATYNITIDPGEMSTSFPVSIFDDASETADEVVTFTLSLQNNFPDAWGAGTEDGTIDTGTLVLTIDDRDDGVIGFVDPLPEFYEPYPGEPTYKRGPDDAVDRYFEMSISEIPRQAFNLRLEWNYSHLKPVALIYEVGIPNNNWVTPEDAADGILNIRFPIESGPAGADAPREYLRLVVNEGSLPEGWRVGQHTRMDYAVISTAGGQVWVPPNDTQVGNVLCNPSFITEDQEPDAKVCIRTNSYHTDSPVWVRLVGGTGSARDNDLGFQDSIVTVRKDTTLRHFDIGIPNDGEREEDKTYTLLVEEAPGFPRGYGRRVDPERNLYTFTVLANGGSVNFHPNNSTTLEEGEGMRQLSLALEGAATPPDGMSLSLSSSNPALVDIPDAYKNFTIPANHLSSYPFSVDVKADDNTVNDTVTLTLRKGTDFPGGWEFKGGGEELTLDLAVIDTSSSPPDGTIQFLEAGRTVFEPKLDPVSGGTAKRRERIQLQVTAPPLVAFDLPIEVSGSASFGIPDLACALGCLDGTYDVVRETNSPSNAILPVEAPDEDTVFARIQPAAGRLIHLDFRINDDTDFEGAESFVLTIPEDAPLPTGFTLGERRRFVLTISANDNVVEFASGESSIIEGGLHNTVAVNFTNPLPSGAGASVVMRATLNGGASANDYVVSGVTGGSSFDARTSTFTIPAGVGSLTFSFAANDDAIADPGESVTFTLDADASSFPENWGGIGSQASHTVTIRDDEVTSIGFAGTTVAQVREGNAATLLVNASANIGNDPAEFEWTVSPAEYVANPTGRAALTSRNYVLEIMAKDNDVAEFAKEVTVTLADGDTDDIWTIDGGNASRTFTIPASDNTVTFSAPSPATISENGGVANITATIKRPALSGGAPVVAVTPSGNASSSDYSFSVATGNGSLSGNTWTLPTGGSKATLTVTATDNNADAGNKTLTLGFANAPSMPVGWDVSGAASHTIVITDDDDAASAGTVQFAHASSNAVEGAEDATLLVPVLVSGTPATAFDLTVNVVNGGEDGAATQGGSRDFTVPATVNISRSGSTNLEVAILADALSEFDETIVLEIPSARNDNGMPAGFNLGAIARHTVTIGANGNTIGFEPGDPLVITDRGSQGHLTVNINNRIAVAGHTVRVEVDGDVANDYEIRQDGGDHGVDVLSLPTGRRVTTIGVATLGIEDEVVAETITLTLVEQDLPDGWSIDAENSTYTVSVNDTILGNSLGFASSALTVKEQAGNVQMEVSASAPAPSGGLPLVVTLAKGVGSKVSFAGDASATTHNFTIAEGETQATFPITVGDDANELADEEVTFTLSFGEDFPHHWGRGVRSATLDSGTLVLTIDDRDDGVIGFVHSFSEFREPYLGEATVRNAQYDTIYHSIEMHISEVPRQGFDLRFLWGYPTLRPLASALHHEVHFPYAYRITPEDAADGSFSVPFGVARDSELEETEYFRLRMNAESLPAGWSVGEHPHLDYAILDSSGGQIWFAPNDTQAGSTTYNPSTITENDTDHTVKVRITTNAVNIDTPVIVELEGYTSSLGFAIRHPDIYPTNSMLVISNETSSVRSTPDGVVWDIDFDLTVRADNRREEAETYTLVLKEVPDVPDEQHGRRVDPARNKYTFTIPANDNSIPEGILIGFAANAPAEVDEGGDTVSIPIDISTALPEEISFTVSLSGNAENGDYTIQEREGYNPGTGTLTLSQNAVEGRLVFAVTNPESPDDTDDENVRIELTGELPEGYNFWNHVHTVNIREPRTVQFINAETETIYEGETASANIRLSKASIPDITIPLLVSGDPDAYGLEATSPSGASVEVDGQRVNVNFGSSGRNNSVTLTMTAREDGDFIDESITVSIDRDNLPLGHSATLATGTWTVNMIDNDKRVQFAHIRADVHEWMPGEGNAGNHGFGNIFADGCASQPSACVIRYFNLIVYGVPTESFDVRFRKWGNTAGNLNMFHFFYSSEWGYPTRWRLTPENVVPAQRGHPALVRVPILVAHDNEAERSEFWAIELFADSLPRGWRVGSPTNMIVVIPCNDGHSCQE